MEGVVSQSIAEKKREWRALMSVVQIWTGTEQMEEADKVTEWCQAQLRIEAILFMVTSICMAVVFAI